ncbi:MAG: VC0807 family protein [Ktedonobacteraceae bacterium]
MTTMNLTSQQTTATLISQQTTVKLVNQQASALSSSSIKSLVARMVPMLLEGSIPFAVYMTVKATFNTSDVVALSIGTLVPVALGVFRFARNRRVDIMNLLIMLGLVASIIAVVLGGSPQILLIRESAFGALFGLAFLGSLFMQHPLFFYLMRHFRCGNDAGKIAIFSAQWNQPKFRNACRLVTAVMGLGCLGEFALRVFFVFTMSVPMVLALSTVVFPAIYITMAVWTLWYMRHIQR